MMFGKAVALSVFALGIGAVFGEGEGTYHWTGAVSGAWTEPGNWLEDEMPTSDGTVIFDRATANATIDLAGMVSISNIVVSGSTVPKITFGTSSSQYLIFVRSGSITVDSEVVAAPETVAGIKFLRGSENTGTTITLRNDSADTFRVGPYNGPIPAFSGWGGTTGLKFIGTGSFVITANSSFSSGGMNYYLGLTATEGRPQPTVSFEPSSINFHQVTTVANSGEQYFVVPSGKTLNNGSMPNTTLTASTGAPLVFDGEGTLYISYSSGNACNFLGQGGASITVNCKLRRYAGCGLTLGFWSDQMNYFNNEVDITGPLILSYGSDLTVSSLTSPTVAGGTGTGNLQFDYSNSTFTYTGGSATLYNPIVLNANANIYNNGTGTMRIEGAVSGANNLYLHGGPFEIATDVPNTLNLEAGISCGFANKPEQEYSTISVGKLYLGGATTMAIADGIRVEAAQYDGAGAKKLNIVTGSGKLVLDGLERGDAPSWITVNGGAAVVGDGGEIASLDHVSADVSIDARGGAVSDSETDIVSIDTAEGAGDRITLGNPPTTAAWILRQNQAEVPAVVELQDGETLNVAKLHVSTGARPLCIRTAADATATLSAATITGDRVELGGTLTVGNLTLGSGGVLAVADGTITGGTILKSPNDSDRGFTKAFYQTGGVVNTQGDGNRVGASGGCIYSELAGGEFNVSGSAYYGYYGLAMLAIKGGTTTFGSGSFYLQAASGGFAHCYQTGGAFLQTNPGSDLYIGGGQNGNAVWTVEGAGALTKVRSATDGRNVVVGSGLSSSTATPAQGILNINDGGVVHSGTIVATKNHSATCKAYLHFDGGIFHNNYAYGRVFGEPGGQWFDPLDRITVFSRGAVISNTVNCSTVIPLDKPTGKGISAIAWTDTTTTFLGAPLVRIVGDGYGASAVAVFDSATRTVTGIHVTSPGCDYTEATAKVLYGTSPSTGAPIEIASIPCTLVDNVSGGLIKTGGSTFTLNAVSTYTGPTEIRSGVLTLGVDNAIDPASELVLVRGKLNLNGKEQTFSSIDCRSGEVVTSDNVAAQATVTGLRIDLDAALAGTVKKVDMRYAEFTSGAALSLVNYAPEKLQGQHTVALAEYVNGMPAEDLVLPSLDLPAGWSLRRRGAKILLHHAEPLYFLVR